MTDEADEHLKCLVCNGTGKVPWQSIIPCLCCDASKIERKTNDR